MWEISLAFVVLCAYFIYKNVIKVNNFWKEKGAPYDPPVYFFGNFLKTALQLSTMMDNIHVLYNKFRNERYVGLYLFTKPLLLVRDPELIRRITVNDFEYFSDHVEYIPADIDPLWGLNLFSLSAKNGWHNMRSTLSPSFTSSKIRTIFTLMQECAKGYVDYLNTQEGQITLELKDTFIRFANDVIGSVAFGITCNSLKNRKNEFYLMGKQVTNFMGLRGWVILSYIIFPKLIRLFKVKIIPNKCAKFFKSVITETIKYRAEKNIVRPDMIHLLTEARKCCTHQDNENVVDSGFAVVEEFDSLKNVKQDRLELTDEVVTAQALVFFFAGFDTVSTGIAYMFYQIAVEPIVQEKLYKEIQETVGNSTESTTYEELLSMQYLHCVVTETFRMHPPAQLIDRKCTKPYTIEAGKFNEKPLHLEKDSVIWIPIREIHRDPQYYPDPDKFIPERFSSVNKHTNNPLCYIPFGSGPRSCIGSRFGLVECKLIIVEVLRQYELIPVEKTEIPITMSKNGIIPIPINGLWIGLNRRK